VIARSRLSTLDGELREAAEQMLRDKFFPKNNSTEIDRDILEALQRKSFFDDIPQLDEGRVKTTYSYGDDIALLEITVATPNYECLMEAIRKIKNQSHRRCVYSAQVIMSPTFYKYLLYQNGTSDKELRYRLMDLGFRLIVDDLIPDCKITMEVDR